VIQQKANTENSELNYKQILEELGINICERLDINPQNCGAIDDSPIIFDFCEV
jgi:hypothetical protein